MKTLRSGTQCLGLLPLLALLIPLGAAGNAAAMEITQPQPQQFLTWMPLDLAIEFDATADVGTLVVTLNGDDVTSFFVVDPPAGGVRVASAVDVWGTFVLLGSNTLTASVEVATVPQQDSVVFELVGDPYADEVVSLSIGTQGGFNSTNLDVVLGAPQGASLFQGGLDVLSLGFSVGTSRMPSMLPWAAAEEIARRACPPRKRALRNVAVV